METCKALVEGITQDIISFLVEDKNIPIKEAMETLYQSILFDKLSDQETGLYRESAGYVYALLKDELKNKIFIQAEI